MFAKLERPVGKKKVNLFDSHNNRLLIFQSFVKNMTSRVSGLLPATITRWFSSPKSSANGSAPAADATDSSTEDEAPESPASQPPAKRMRYSPGAVYASTDVSITLMASLKLWRLRAIMTTRVTS